MAPCECDCGGGRCCADYAEFCEIAFGGLRPYATDAAALGKSGARTAWHSHRVGQVLYAVSGVGRVQLEGEPVQILHPGDTALIPPNTRHWHGAAPDMLFTHLAMSETDDKRGGTSWFEHASDADYLKKPASVG